MGWLVSIAISNAVVATLLGVLAYAICRRTKSTSFAHLLWVLVLLKLVTPPLLGVPLPILPQWASANAEIASTLETDTTPATPGDQQNGQADLGLESATALLSDQSATVSSIAGQSPATAAGHGQITLLIPWILWTWLAGGILFGLYQIFVTAQMCRLMRMAAPDPRIDRAMHRIAKSSNIKNYPTARVVPWVGSPMLWGLRGTSVVVLPAKLLAKIDDDAADTLLRHELAHFQRGDQWVRILEIVVSVIFWWHPLVWFAVRQIEIYEEQCCDAWVVAQDHANRKKYAKALLDTVDFIADARARALPVVASGLGRVRLLEKRVKAILQGDQRVSLTPRGRLALAGVLILIPLRPDLTELNISTPPQPAESSMVVADTEAPAPAAAPISEFTAQAAQGYVNGIDIFSRAPGPEYAKATSPYGTYELTAKRGFEVELRDVVRGVVSDLSKHRISCAAFTPHDGSKPKFAAGTHDGIVYLFDCASSKVVKPIGNFEAAINSVAYSWDGSQLAVGNTDGFVFLIDPASKKPTRKIDNRAPVRCVRFSPDGTIIAIATETTWQKSAPGQVDLYDAATLEQIGKIECPTAIGVAGFSSAGFVVTAEWNGMVRTWTLDGIIISESKQSKDTVSAAAFSPNAITMEMLAQ